MLSVSIGLLGMLAWRKDFWTGGSSGTRRKIDGSGWQWWTWALEINSVSGVIWEYARTWLGYFDWTSYHVYCNFYKAIRSVQNIYSYTLFLATTFFDCCVVYIKFVLHLQNTSSTCRSANRAFCGGPSHASGSSQECMYH